MKTTIEMVEVENSRINSENKYECDLFITLSDGRNHSVHVEDSKPINKWEKVGN